MGFRSPLPSPAGSSTSVRAHWSVFFGPFSTAIDRVTRPLATIRCLPPGYRTTGCASIERFWQETLGPTGFTAVEALLSLPRCQRWRRRTDPDHAQIQLVYEETQRRLLHPDDRPYQLRSHVDSGNRDFRFGRPDRHPYILTTFCMTRLFR